MPMTELGPEARALLDAAREGLSPSPSAVRRVRARIQLAATGAAAGTALATKLAVVAAVVVAVGAAVLLGLGRGPTPVAVPALDVARPSAAPPQVAAHEAPAVVPTAPGGSLGDEDLITIEPIAPPSRERTQRSTRPAQTPRNTAPQAPAERPDPETRRAIDPTGETLRRGGAAGVPGLVPRARSPIALGREVELVDLAMAALRRGDAAGALRIVHDYTAEAAGAGQLTQDAAAIEIEALCRLGDPRARDKLAGFDLRFPRSAQRSRLEAACR
jgi:hypothetical protein